MLTVMASFTGRSHIDASGGNEQPPSYTVYSSVTVGADAYVRTKPDGDTGGAPPQSSSTVVPSTTAERLYSSSDFGPVPRICLKSRHDEQCSAGPSTSAAIQEEGSMIIIETIFPFGFILFYVSFKIGQVDFTFVRVAPTGETEPMGENEMPMPELDI